MTKFSNNKIEKLGYDWITANPEKVDVVSDYYCQTRDVFEARLEKMKVALSENKKFSLVFKSGNAEIKINKIFKITKTSKNISGCFAVLKS